VRHGEQESAWWKQIVYVLGGLLLMWIAAAVDYHSLMHWVPGMYAGSVLALLVASIFINFIDRSNLSVAVTDIEKELSLDDRQAGLLLSGFFWTYALFQIAAGWLVDRYNAYWVYAAGFLLWSVATALTGFGVGFAVLFGLRLVLGAGESVAYPAYSRIISDDFPERRRGLANALLDAGSKAGPAVGTLLGGLIVARFGWRPLFFGLAAQFKISKTAH